MTLARAPNVVLSTRAASGTTPSARFAARTRRRALEVSPSPLEPPPGTAQDPIVGGKAAQDAARKALQGAMGGKRDVLSQFDGGQRGGPLDWFLTAETAATESAGEENRGLDRRRRGVLTLFNP